LDDLSKVQSISWNQILKKFKRELVKGGLNRVRGVKGVMREIKKVEMAGSC